MVRQSPAAAPDEPQTNRTKEGNQPYESDEPGDHGRLLGGVLARVPAFRWWASRTIRAGAPAWPDSIPCPTVAVPTSPTNTPAAGIATMPAVPPAAANNTPAAAPPDTYQPRRGGCRSPIQGEILLAIAKALLRLHPLAILSHRRLGVGQRSRQIPGFPMPPSLVQRQVHRSSP